MTQATAQTDPSDQTDTGAQTDPSDQTSTSDKTTAAIGVSVPEGTLTPRADRWVLTLTRRLPHPVEQVWPMLVEPAQLGRWSPVMPDRVLETLGPATSRETPSSPAVELDVLVIDAPRELVYRWGPGELRWTLRSVAGGTELTLEHTFDDRDACGSFGAGWHICLAVLSLVIDGESERIVGPRARDYGWTELRDQYAAMLG